MSDCNCGQPVPVVAGSVEDLAQIQNALGPQSMTINGRSFTMRSISDLIALQKHQLLVAAARNPFATIQSIRLSPSGNCRR